MSKMLTAEEREQRIAELKDAAYPFLQLWNFADVEGRPDDMILYEASGVTTLRLAHLRRLKAALIADDTV